MKARIQNLPALLACMLLAGCGGGSGSAVDGVSTGVRLGPVAESYEITGAGIKGPLAYADAKVYEYDPRFNSRYDQTNPISSAITDQYAQIPKLAIPKSMEPPYILVVGGDYAIDLNTGERPVIPTLTTVVTADMIAEGRPIYATPLTTLALEMAKHASTSDPGRESFSRNLVKSAELVSQVFSIDEELPIDIFSSSLLLDENADTAEKQKEAVHHRAAIEAFAAKIHQLSSETNDNARSERDSTVRSAAFEGVSLFTSNTIIQLLALDLQSDGKIDNADNGKEIGGIDPIVLSQDPMELYIPNTGYRVEDTVDLLSDERIVMGKNNGPELMVSEAVFGDVVNDATNGDDQFVADTPNFDQSPGEVAIAAPVEYDLPIRINVGGGPYTDTLGNLWHGDDGCSSSEKGVVSVDISGTEDDYLFHTHRWGGDGESGFVCSYAVPDGVYKVNVFFAETNESNFAVGARVFDVLINGNNAFDNVDIFGEAGGFKGVRKTKTVEVADGVVDVRFARQSKNPFVKAIEIVPAGAESASVISQPTENSGDVSYTGAMNDNANSLLLAGLLASSSASGDHIFHRDFENEKLGYEYSRDDLKTRMNASNRGLSLSSNAIRIVEDPAPGGERGKVMRFFQPANKHGEGAQWIMDFEPTDEVYFAYEVYFEDDAEFAKGGKLPGLASAGYYPNAGAIADGTDLWSARNMWFADGLLTSYVYHANQPNKYGDTRRWDTEGSGKTYLKRGQWNTIEVRIKINTPGVKDGRLQGWFNGKMVFDTKSFMYRMPGGEHLKIGSLTFMNRYGGGNSTWAPSTNQYIYFDNIVISTKPITH